MRRILVAFSETVNYSYAYRNKTTQGNDMTEAEMTAVRWWADADTRTPNEWRQLSDWCHGAAMVIADTDEMRDFFALSQLAVARAYLAAEEEIPSFLRRQAE